VSPVNIAPNAHRCGFEIEEAIYVMSFPVGRQLIRKTAHGEEWIYVGHPSESSDRRVELLAEYRVNTIEIFHFTDVSNIWRHPWTEE